MHLQSIGFVVIAVFRIAQASFPGQSVTLLTLRAIMEFAVLLVAGLRDWIGFSLIIVGILTLYLRLVPREAISLPSRLLRVILSCEARSCTKLLWKPVLTVVVDIGGGQGTVSKGIAARRKASSSWCRTWPGPCRLDARCCPPI